MIITSKEMKKIREELNFSQRDLADISPYEKSYISGMENGIYGVTLPMHNAIKETLTNKIKSLQRLLDNMNS